MHITVIGSHQSHDSISYVPYLYTCISAAVFTIGSNVLMLIWVLQTYNLFQVDDWSAKVEYLEDWEVVAEEDEGGPALCIKYGVS